MEEIRTVRQRAALQPRRDPYWCALGKWQQLGFRRNVRGTSWVARIRDQATGKKLYRALGDLSDVPPADQFNEAAKLAREFFDHVGAGGRRDTITVLQAWQRYADHQRESRGGRAVDDVLERIKRHVKNDPIAVIQLEKLQKRHVDAWRKRITGTKSKATVNRDITPMRAALRLAMADGFVTSDHAWHVALQPTKNAERSRNVYLDRAQRRALIEFLPPDCAAFARGLCALPLRPGALAALTVRDFDARTSTLTIGKDKAGQDRRILLPDTTAAMLKEQVRNKTPAAPLFARADGKAWDRFAWRKQFRAARAALKLPPEATAYALRHSTITDLVSDGVPTLTVAQISGTSVRMIELHYGHLLQRQAQAALARLAL